jgi:hypothetical protein
MPEETDMTLSQIRTQLLGSFSAADWTSCDRKRRRTMRSTFVAPDFTAHRELDEIVEALRCH